MSFSPWLAKGTNSFTPPLILKVRCRTVSSRLPTIFLSPAPSEALVCRAKLWAPAPAAAPRVAPEQPAMPPAPLTRTRSGRAAPVVTIVARLEALMAAPGSQSVAAGDATEA